MLLDDLNLKIYFWLQGGIGESERIGFIGGILEDKCKSFDFGWVDFDLFF
jgi:hypothetical protein